jgi:hypothetical protein
MVKKAVLEITKENDAEIEIAGVVEAAQGAK